MKTSSDIELETPQQLLSDYHFAYKKNINHLRPQLKSYDKGEFIYLQKEQTNAVYLIVSGKVKILSYAENGRETLKHILAKGDLFGETGLLEEDQYKDFAIAFSENTRIYKYSVDEFQHLIKKDPEFAIKVYKIISTRLKQLEKRINLLCIKDTKTRLLEFILDHCQTYGIHVNAHIEIENHFTHQDIADLIGTTRQTVTSLLNDWKRKNLLSCNRNKMIIWNKAGIEQLKNTI